MQLVTKKDKKIILKIKFYSFSRTSIRRKSI